MQSSFKYKKPKFNLKRSYCLRPVEGMFKLTITIHSITPSKRPVHQITAQRGRNKENGDLNRKLKTCFLTLRFRMILVKTCRGTPKHQRADKF